MVFNSHKLQFPVKDLVYRYGTVFDHRGTWSQGICCSILWYRCCSVVQLVGRMWTNGWTEAIDYGDFGDIDIRRYRCICVYYSVLDVNGLANSSR